MLMAVLTDKRPAGFADMNRQTLFASIKVSALKTHQIAAPKPRQRILEHISVEGVLVYQPSGSAST